MRERANVYTVRANEQTDKRVAQYPDSWLSWTIDPSVSKSSSPKLSLLPLFFPHLLDIVSSLGFKGSQVDAGATHEVIFASKVVIVHHQIQHF